MSRKSPTGRHVAASRSPSLINDGAPCARCGARVTDPSPTNSDPRPAANPRCSRQAAPCADCPRLSSDFGWTLIRTRRTPQGSGERRAGLWRERSPTRMPRNVRPSKRQQPRQWLPAVRMSENVRTVRPLATWFPRLFCPVRSAVLSPCTVGGVGHLGTRPSAFTLGPLGAPLLLARRPKQNGHDEILFSPPSTRTNVRKRNSGAGNQTVWFRPFPASRLCAHPRHSHCLMLRPKPDVQSGRGLRLPNASPRTTSGPRIVTQNHLRPRRRADTESSANLDPEAAMYD